MEHVGASWVCPPRANVDTVNLSIRLKYQLEKGVNMSIRVVMSVLLLLCCGGMVSCYSLWFDRHMVTRGGSALFLEHSSTIESAPEYMSP